MRGTSSIASAVTLRSASAATISPLVARRALHLQHELGAAEELGGPGDDDRSSRLVLRVGEAGRGARAALDGDVVPRPLQATGRVRNEGDAPLLRRRLAWDPDPHPRPP